ncbi:MAG: DUF2299 domain-containing protein [Acidilobus sp.]|nr:DUF2299 domain-containing protein [Acidilobus sp.]
MGLKEDVMRWLKEEDIDVEEVQVPPNVPIEWALNATVKAPLRVMIGVQKPKTKTERLVLSMIVKVADQHRAAMSSMSERDRLKSMTELLMRLISVCPDCVVIFQPQLGSPDTIVVSRVLYEDQINPSSIGGTVRTLVNEYAVIVGYFNAEVGGAWGSASTTIHM